MNLKIIGIFMLAISMFVVSCKKDDEDIAQAVSEEEAVEVVENSLKSGSAGMVEQLNESVIIIESLNLKNDYCGMSFDTTITITNPSGTLITFEYTFSWNWLINCNINNIPETFDFSYNMNGYYDAPRMSSEDTATHIYQISDLDPDSVYFEYNGNYQRHGTHQSKIGMQHSFTSDLTIETSEILIDKVTRKIVSGTAHIYFIATTSWGKTFIYEGTIIFNGNDIATLTIGDNEYSFDL